jgi:diadenosine tetraphosphate (Ap4A) HIT family hydrolase/pimeloyl-ACP methyl ester carboxylesterase
MIELVAPFIAACAPLAAPSVSVPPAVVLGRPYDAQNPFAKMIRGEIGQAKVYEDRRVLAFMDYSPASPGHVLVISKTSRGRNLLEMSDSDLKRLMRVARRIGRAEMAGLGADGFTLEQNNAFSQSVPHLHVHVIPRYLGYNRCVGSGLRQPPEVLERFAARIRAGLTADTGGAVPLRPADDRPAPATAPATGQRALYSEAADRDSPAAMAAVRLPSRGSNLNAVLYLAAGAGPHPTLLLLHGFPGNEQNLDLAQAVRRAGWNVLTLHYRGSWGSEGAFSFLHAAEDAQAALGWLHDDDVRRRYRIDARRLVVAGHSMGGMMAARAAAADRTVTGTILIDPWDIAATGRTIAADATARQDFVEGELRPDLPPLAGTGEATLLREIVTAPPAFDLVATAPALSDRPLLIFGAERGLGDTARRTAEAATAAPGGGAVQLTVLPTDHSFSDHRLALTQAVIDWLGRLPVGAQETPR